jgi:serine phosphatase RsbU (regulator of sigma subunit)
MNFPNTARPASAPGLLGVVREALYPLIPYGFQATLYLIFVVMPLGICSETALQFLEKRHHQEQKHQTELQEKQLDELLFAQDRGTKVADAIHPFLIQVRGMMSEKSRLGKKFRAVVQKHPMEASFQLFLLGSATIAMGSPMDVELASDVIHQMGVAAPAPQETLEARIKKTFGPEASLQRFREHNGEFMPISMLQGDGIAFFETRPDGLSMAFTATHLSRELTNDFAERYRARLPLRKRSGTAFPSAQVWNPPEGIAPGDMRSAFALFEGQTGPFVEFRSRRWFFSEDRFGKVTGMVFPGDSVSFDQLQERRWWVLTAAVLLAVAGLFWHIRLFSGGGIRVSLRYQLWVLFSGVTLLPLLAGSFLAWNGIEERREHLKSLAQKTCTERLQMMESQYPEARQKQLAVFRALRNSPEILAGDGAGTRQILQRAVRDGVTRFGMVIDSQSRHVYSNFIGIQEKAIYNMGKLTVKWFSPHRVALGDSKKVDPMEVMMEDLAVSDSLGLSSVAESPNLLHDLRHSKSGFNLFWDVYPELATGPVFICLMVEQEEVLQSFLTRQSAQLRGDYPVFFWEARTDAVLPDTPEPLDETLVRTLVLSYKCRRLLQRELETAQGPFWVAAMPDTVFDGYGFIAVRSARDALKSLRPYKIGALLGIVVGLCMTVFAGRFLADLFLGPVQDLQAGIEAIRKRQRDFRLVPRRDDEFGALAELFNGTLKNLREAELAQAVQNQLFPQKLPSVPGYELEVFSISASDLGGDYYDVVTLPNGGILFVIGDATGHGTSAALVMAMAKGVFQYFSFRESFSLDDVVTEINRVFHQELKASKKYMTMTIGLLDPDQHTIELRNAGHPFPLHYHAEKKELEMREMPGFLLGMRRKIQLLPFSFSLAANDFMLLYTDGFTECDMNDGTQLGDKDFARMVLNAQAEMKNAGDFVTRLYQDLDSRRKPGPRGDDITLVMIRRLPSGVCTSGEIRIQ